MKKAINQLKELRNNIAASIFLSPCDEDELMDRDFLKTKSRYGVGRLLFQLEQQGAIFEKQGKMYVKKKWAKKNLKDYDLDFRTKKEKEQAGWTDFKKDIYNKFNL